MLTKTENAHLWHRRLGHPSSKVLTKMLQIKALGETAQVQPCISCIEAKQKRDPFPNHYTQRSQRILEIVHADVCGPFSPTPSDQRYIVSFIDDYTRYARIFVIENKSEVLACFKIYEASATALTSQRIAYLRCDNGGEFISALFKTFTEDKGITMQYTVPYTPQQNGVAERYNRTLMEKVRAVLYESKLEKYFWAEAAYYVAYTLNRTITTCLENDYTPAEIFPQKEQNYSKLRVFGCIAHRHIPDACRTKLDKKSEVCAFVGYAENGYRL